MIKFHIYVICLSNNILIGLVFNIRGGGGNILCVLNGIVKIKYQQIFANTIITVNTYDCFRFSCSEGFYSKCY